jgi:hypothetical protein
MVAFLGERLAADRAVAVLNQGGLNLFFDNHLLQVFQDLLAFCQRQTSRFQPQRAVSLKGQRLNASARCRPRRA